MKKTIALMLAMLFAVCAFATTAFADEPESSSAAAQATETPAANDDVNDGFNETPAATEAPTAAPTAAPTEAPATTAKAEDTATTTNATIATTAGADVTATLAPGQTAYEGQGDEGKETTKKPAQVDTTIPATGSGIVVPAIALAVLAAGTVAVIKTKKEG